MLIQGRSVRAGAGMPRGAAWGGRAGRLRPGRLIPIILAFYLTPALLLVLLVGGIGMIVLAIARAITSIIHGRPLKASSGG
jgi:hypothetical protein